MDNKRIKFAIITAAFNEEGYLENTIKSVIKQTHLPIIWVIISDGSTDRTDDIIKKYLKDYDWIEYIRMPDKKEHRFDAKIQCINAGLKKIENINYEVIGNLDADITFEEKYFEFLMKKFQEDPAYGVIGTPFIENSDNISIHDMSNLNHVSGACQLFRRKCFEEIGGFKPIKDGGEDWNAVTTARMLGWKTRSFPEMHSFHHRPIGTGKINNVLYSRFFYGKRDYQQGGHPFWEIFRCIFQMKNKPYIFGGLFLFFGYFSQLIQFKKRFVTKELMKFHRKEQMDRLKKIIFKKI